MKKTWEVGGGYIIYPGKGKITDVAVANYVRKHTRLIDRFNVEKMTSFVLYAQSILMGVVDEPKGNWVFKYLGKK